MRLTGKPRVHPVLVQGRHVAGGVTPVLPKHWKPLEASSMELRVHGGMGKGPHASAASMSSVVFSLLNTDIVVVSI